MDENTSQDLIFFQVFNEIGIINQLGSTAFQKTLPDGLKISQFSVLNHFVRLGDDSTPLQLANAFQVTKGAMTDTLRRLLDRELITIRPDPNDGRRKRVFITEKGRITRDQCIHQVTRLFEILKKSFSESDFRTAIPFLQKLREVLDKERNSF
jgi:DNA-binding MarR family transcriptional regulator